MNVDWRLMVWGVMLLGFPSLAAAQPPHRHPDGPPPKPPATVVARVNVNVETEVDVAAGAAATEDDDSEDDDDDDRNEASKPRIEDLVTAALKHPGTGTSVLVIADININVETSVKVRVPAKSRDASAQPAEAAKSGDDKPKPPGNDSAPPKKKKKRLKRTSGTEEAVAPQPAEPQPAFGLSKLKFGEKLEIGVAGQVETEERARQIATQINQKTTQSLLALALAGMIVPEQSESLGVVRKAVSSVKAEAAGNEISISAAIPRETPRAIKTLVDAAIQKGK